MAITKPNKRQIYNPNLKQKFINAQSFFTDATKDIYEYALSKSHNLEERWEKDLCEFNDVELDILFSDLQCKSLESVKTQFSIISNYITYCIQNGLSHQTVNFATGFTTKSLEKYVDRIWETKKTIDREDIYDIDMECENKQDSAPFIMAFEGIFGNNLDEMINLKTSDINELTGEVKLERGIITIDKRSAKILLQAAEETEYVKNNGKNLNKMKFTHYELMESEYVLKNIKRVDMKNQISPQSIRQRFAKIKDVWNNKYLTPTSVYNSGIIDYAKRYKEENNIEELSIADYDHIGKRFGYGSTIYKLRSKIKEYV